jgi:Trypsin
MKRTFLVFVGCLCVTQAAITARNQTEDNSLPVLLDLISGNDKQILKGVGQLRSTGESYDCRCGERNDLPRIVGGKATKANEFPWMARLTYLNKFYCAGSLINDLYVLTAGHCIET